MAPPFDRPVVSPVVVGRTRHLVTLESCLQQARAGQGLTLLIAGEAGIGKSRLAREARASAARLGMLVLQGNCFEHDHSLPYAPILDLLRGLLASQPLERVLGRLGSGGADLAALLPELTSAIPAAAAAQGLDPRQEKRRHFHALTQAFAALAAAQPLLLLVEDLHWSDDTSLEFLLYLARVVPAQPILLLATYRDDEAGPGLVHLLAELDRQRLAAELRLIPLSVVEVETMLRAIFDLPRPVRADFLHALYSLTEGNPFFIEEVLRSLISAGDIFYVEGVWDRKPLHELRIPRSVQDAVRRRTTALGDAARRVLTLAAVAGRRFDFALLQDLTGLDEPELLSLVRELIAAQLVQEESAEVFAFRHALTRQAVYSQLLARERKALHLRIGEALERRGGQDSTRLADLAYHFFEAGAWAKALEYALRVGEQACALYSPRAAVDHLSRALAAATSLQVPPPLAAHRLRGLAYETLGEFELARADFEAALRLAEEAADRCTEWRLLLDLGLLWAGRDYQRSGQYLQRALALARQIGDPRLVAHSLNRAGNWHLNLHQPGQAQAHHQEALAIFRELNDRQGIAATLDLLGMTSLIVNEFVRAAKYYREAAAIFRELDDRQGLATVLASSYVAGPTYQGDLAVLASTPGSAQEQEGAAAVELARSIGWRAGEAFALLNLACCLGPRGEFGRALAHARAALAIAEEIEHRQWLAYAHWTLGVLLLDLLALTHARRHLERSLGLGQEISSLHWMGEASGFLASAAILERDLEYARAVLDHALAADTPVETIGQRHCWCARAELQLAGGDAAGALATLDRLRLPSPDGGAEPVIPRLWRLRAEALVALGQPAEAEGLLRAACGAAGERGERGQHWRAHAALASLLEREGRYGECGREAATALALIEASAATVAEEDLRAAFLRQAAATLPAEPAARPAPRPPGGLTPREREVAALIARGLSNREVAEALVVGERTVETHVGNILAKLGFSSRTQIAAWAVEHGLARSDPG